MEPLAPITDPESRRYRRLDAFWLAGWLVFLGVLAAFPPRLEWHKQIILLAIGIVQILETKIIAYTPKRGVVYVMLLKIFLATLLLDHTGDVGINSAYYGIYYLPVVTAAVYCGTWGTLFWTLFASAAYCSYLYPAMQEYELAPDALEYLGLRIMFFFLAAMVVNRFSQQSRHQTELYRELAERLAETNRRLEQAQAEARRSERLAALGQLSAGLAHEIRNPLGVIKGSAEMLNQKLESAAELPRELAGYILTEVNRLSALVTEFLDFARPLHAQCEPAEITKILDRTIETVSDRWKGKPVRVERNYADALPLVPLDESLCEQAFLNLVQNAFEAMEETGGTLRVEARTAFHEGKEGIEVLLSDTGPGVPQQLLEEIFNPFVTTKKTGVGLGLSIVSKIIDSHHGFIHVENRSKGGAERTTASEIRTTGSGDRVAANEIRPTGGAVFTLFFPQEEIPEPHEVQANRELRTEN